MEIVRIKKEMTRAIFGSIKQKNKKNSKWNKNEIKALFIIIKKMQKENNVKIEMNLKDFGDKVSRRGNYEYMDNLLNSIKTKDFYLKLDEKYRNYSLLSYIEYDKKESIKVKFNEDLRDLIFNNSSFSKINITELLKLNSYYSIIAKIILSNATNIKEFKMDIDRFKLLFQVPTSFKQNKIKEKVFNNIEKDVEEVEKIEFIKKGRKATGVTITMNYNNKVITRKEVFTPGLEKSIQKCKRNIYISKAWNGSMDKKIKKIEKEKGLEFAKELLDKLYISLNSEITTSLVAYTNTIIETIPVAKKENLSQKNKVLVEKVEKTEKKELTKEEKEEILRKNKEFLKKMRIGG